jgi:glucokinase
VECSIGIDIGGTKIAAGIVDRSGRVLHRLTIPTPSAGKNDILVTLREVIQRLSTIEIKHETYSIVGVGIGTAGQIDFDSGRVLSGTVNIKEWNDVPLRDYVSEFSNLPVWVDNDVNVFALAEAHLGAAEGHRHVVCLTLGTGVGGGVISNGHLVRGAWGGAAELGHVSIDMNGPMCNCGLRGCLETYASGPGIARIYKEKLSSNIYPSVPSVDSLNSQMLEPQSITSKTVFQLMRDGDPIARETVELVVQALAVGIVNFIHTFNPTMVVLGGGVMNQGEWLCEAVAQKVYHLGIHSLVQPVQIRVAKLGSDAGLIGAAYQTWVY